MTMKNWWESRTIWVNVLTLITVVIGQLMGWDELKQYTSELLVVSNVANVLLRLITSTAITK